MLASEIIRNHCWAQFGSLMEAQLCFHCTLFLKIVFWFCCFSACRKIRPIYVNANLKEWIKCGFHQLCSPRLLLPSLDHLQGSSFSQPWVTLQRSLEKQHESLPPACCQEALEEREQKRKVFYSWLLHHFLEGRFEVFSNFHLNWDSFPPVFAPLLFTVSLYVGFLLRVGVAVESTRRLGQDPASQSLGCFNSCESWPSVTRES